jgi:hypothetical protein
MGLQGGSVPCDIGSGVPQRNDETINSTRRVIYDGNRSQVVRGQMIDSHTHCMGSSEDLGSPQGDSGLDLRTNQPT